MTTDKKIRNPIGLTSTNCNKLVYYKAQKCQSLYTYKHHTKRKCKFHLQIRSGDARKRIGSRSVRRNWISFHRFLKLISLRFSDSRFSVNATGLHREALIDRFFFPPPVNWSDPRWIPISHCTNLDFRWISHYFVSFRSACDGLRFLRNDSLIIFRSLWSGLCAERICWRSSRQRVTEWRASPSTLNGHGSSPVCTVVWSSSGITVWVLWSIDSTSTKVRFVVFIFTILSLSSSPEV